MGSELPEGWSIRSLGSFCHQFKHLNGNRPEIEPLSITKHNGIVLQSEKFNKRIATNTEIYKVIKRGEFAYDPMSLYYGSIGQLSVADEGVVSPAYITFSVDSTVNDGWANSYFQSETALTAYISKTQGGNLDGKRKKTDWEGFASIIVLCPPLAEQKKIAQILSSVDEAIQATQAVIDQTRRVKEAMLQTLLTRGLGHTRFQQTEIGEIPEGWEVRPFGTVVESLDSHRVPVKAEVRKTMSGTVPYYGASGIIDYVAESLFNEELLLLAEDGANILTRSTPVAFVINGPSWVNNHAHVYRQKGATRLEFLAHVLESQKMDRWATGSAQPKLNAAVVSMIPVQIPPVSEQIRICEILGAIEADIDSYASIMKQVAIVKSALLQTLLSGQTRVTP